MKAMSIWYRLILISGFHLLILTSCTQEPVEKKLKQLLVYRYTIVDGKEANKQLVEKTSYTKDKWITSEIRYGENGEIDYQNKFKYDGKGREIEDVYILHGKLNSICKTSYNSKDSVLKYSLYKPDKKLDFIIHVLYDKSGLNTKNRCINADHSIRFWDEYKYDKSGNQTKWVRYNPDSTIQSEVLYKYDRKNRDIKHTCSGELGGTYVFKYDKKGLKSGEIAFNTKNQLFLWLKEYNYDNSNRLTKIMEYNGLNHRPKNPSRIFRYEYQFWKE
jgi:hypothetical protein